MDPHLLMDAQNIKLNQIVFHRFTDFLISDQVTKQRLGLINQAQTTEVNRNLLSVEAKAQQEKLRRSKTAEEFLIYVNEYFHDALLTYIEHVVANNSVLFGDIFKLDAQVITLVQTCLNKNANANQIAELVSQLPWLKKDLLSIVNKPPFRDEASTKPMLDDVMLAVRYVGPDNIRMPILALIVKHWQPHSTEPYNNSKTKLWQYSVATANCMEQLAPSYRIDPLQGYFLGLAHGVGFGLALRLYLRSFEKVRLNEMKKARQASRPDIEKALNQLQLDGEFASETIFKHGWSLSVGLMKKLDLKLTPILPAIEQAELWPEEPTDSVLATLLVKASTYGQYKVLQKARLIELNEAKRFLTGAQINNEFISNLNQVDLSRLNLTSTHI